MMRNRRTTGSLPRPGCGSSISPGPLPPGARFDGMRARRCSPASLPAAMNGRLTSDRQDAWLPEEEAVARYEFINQPDPSAGFRLGARGTHTSRTIMLAELDRALHADATREKLAELAIKQNLFAKATASGRALTLQRLRELYALDDAIPLFRVLLLLWRRDPSSLPLLGILAALARDPLLRATAEPVVSLWPGSELARDSVRDAISVAGAGRLSEATAAKVGRNAASSWTQSGHLSGRTFKRRTRVDATPVALAFAIWLAHAAGIKGEAALSSGWVRVLDLDGRDLPAMIERARVAGLISVRQLGSRTELDPVCLPALKPAA